MKIGTRANFPCELFGLEKGLAMIARAGYSSVDYAFPELRDLGIIAETDEAIMEYYSNVRTEIQKNHLRISQTHAPIPTVSEERDNHMVFEAIRKSLLASSVLGADCMIVHPVYLGIMEDGSFVRRVYDRNKELCRKANMDFFSRMIPYLEKYDTKIAIENIWIIDERRKVICPTACSDPYELAEYIDVLNAMCPSKDRFCACLDVGHANLSCRDMDIRKIVNVLGKRLQALHVHDNDGLHDLHTAPGLGNVDWEGFCLGLKDIGYEGEFTFEDVFYRNFDESLFPEVLRFLYQLAYNMCERYGL